LVINFAKVTDIVYSLHIHQIYFKVCLLKIFLRVAKEKRREPPDTLPILGYGTASCKLLVFN